MYPDATRSHCHSYSVLFQISIACLLSDALTCESSFAPASGYTACTSRNIGTRRGQAHGRHAGGQLSWRGQLQQGDIIVEVLTVVVGMRDGLWKFEVHNVYIY